MPEPEIQPEIQLVVASTRDYYDGPADQIYRSIWGDNIHLGVPCGESCPHPEAMEHTNQIMAEAVSLSAATRVLDLGCGYGSTARYLAAHYGCHVTGTNISGKELELARERARESNLEKHLSFQYGDFHDLKYADASYDVVWSQEAFLHGADKKAILSECSRVLVPGGALAFTDILVRRETSDADRQRIYDRVKSPDMWDLEDYRRALRDLRFLVQPTTDWSRYVARSYGWVRDRLGENREALLPRIGAETIDRTLDALEFWVASANRGNIGWAFFLAHKPE
jgi:sarcosine/dimethylglycine N-methyltransferase